MEMMVYWSASEDAFPTGHPEPSNLHHDAEKFPVEDGANHHQQNFLPNGTGKSGQKTSERQGAGVPHENPCRGAVEPQEPETGTCHGSRDDHQFL